MRLSIISLQDIDPTFWNVGFQFPIFLAPVLTCCNFILYILFCVESAVMYIPSVFYCFEFASAEVRIKEMRVSD